jgi:hypothetical protein
MSVYENPLKEGRVSDPPLLHVDHTYPCPLLPEYDR